MQAGGTDNHKPVVTIPFLESPPLLENFLSMKPDGAVEQKMARVTGFVQREPSDGQPASQKTDVYLGYDGKNLYAVFLAFDTEPGRIRATLSRRENIFNDDIVEIMLDTFHDQRRAFAFITNPYGIQLDAIWTEGQGFDSSFDTLWHSTGQLTPKGYVVLMAIPFKSLRFSSQREQSWGIILARDIHRNSREQMFWPQISSKISGRLNQAGTLTGLKNISPGRNIQFIPYATYRAFRLLDEDATPQPRFVNDNLQAATGLDAKFVLKDRFAVDLTLNPDFNQVESDEPQVTVNQRFEVFFPEKRPFFVENAGYFQTPINLVFTRRIADPLVGGRVTGKAGPYAIGALIINDEAPGKGRPVADPLRDKRAVFGIARISRDISEQSYLALTYTNREFATTFNRVGSIDSRTKLNDNWTTSTQFIASFTQDGTRESFTGTALDLSIDRQGRQFNTRARYRQLTPDFHTDTGFIRRVDLRDLRAFIGYQFRPENDLLTSWGPDLSLQRSWDFNGTRLDERLKTGLEFEFTRQTRVEITYRRKNERLRPQDFPGLTHGTDFAQQRWSFEFRSRHLDQANLALQLGFGTTINFVPPAGQLPALADILDAEATVSLKPLTSLRIDNSYLLTQLTQRETNERIFTNHLLRSRWNWQLTRRLSLRFIFDYEASLVNNALTSLGTEKRFNIDFLLTYLVNPWNALFVGVNYNYRNIELIRDAGATVIVPTHNRFLNDGRQVFLKYSYLLRI